MQKRITFKNMAHSDALYTLAERELHKLEGLLASERTPQTYDLVMEAAHNHAHNRVSLHVTSPDFNLVAHHEGKDLSVELERVMSTMAREIQRAKERVAEERKTRNSY